MFLRRHLSSRHQRISGLNRRCSATAGGGLARPDLSLGGVLRNSEKNCSRGLYPSASSRSIVDNPTPRVRELQRTASSKVRNSFSRSRRVLSRSNNARDVTPSLSTTSRGSVRLARRAIPNRAAARQFAAGNHTAAGLPHPPGDLGHTSCRNVQCLLAVMSNAALELRIRTKNRQAMSTAAFPASTRRIAVPILTFVSFVAPVLAYFWFVDHFALNTIWIDQWSDLGIISHAYSGHLTLSTLWAQHTDNRILFPNLIVLLLAYATHFNIVDEEFLSATILVLSITLLIIGHRRRSPTTPWIFYSPVAILMLSVVQSGNTLWGFQFAWYLVLLALSVSLVLCDSPKWKWFVTAGAISAAIVGSFSSLQGLLIWPAGLLILLLRNRSRRFVFTWIGAAAVTTAIYFVNFNAQSGDTNGYILHHPLEGARFFLFSVGNVIGAHGGNVSVALGLLIVWRFRVLRG
jgi:hypothetical protein